MAAGEGGDVAALAISEEDLQMAKGTGKTLSQSEQVLRWLCRDFDTTEKWKRQARSVFLKSMGDSTLARYYLADDIRQEITGTAESPPPSVSSQEEEGFTLKAADRPKVTPPYVNWIWVADYFLLAAANEWDELDEENQKRRDAYRRTIDGWEARKKVSAVRKYLEGHPKADNEEVKAELKRSGSEIANIQISLARKVPYDTCPGKPELEPELPPFLGPYQSLYF